MRTVPVAGAGQGTNLIRAYCFNTDLPGHAVRILGDKVGGLFQVTKVDISAPSLVASVAIGVIATKTSPSVCTVVLSGLLAGVYTGFPYGRPLFVEDDSFLSITPPARPLSGSKLWQPVAHAIASDVILVNPGQPTRVTAW